MTIRVRRDVPSLRSRRFVAEAERSFRAMRKRGRFRLIHYSIQRNHVHAIVEAASARDLSNGMKALAARLARAVHRVFRRVGRALDDRSHVRVLRTPREVRNAIAYVLLNARRHSAQLSVRLGATASIDPASSGRWFDGWRASPHAIAPDAPVAVPRTWLLAVGWRRFGRIDPGEVPGGRTRSGRP